jgi:SMODS-associated and fused to various effectors sensor domain/CHAT domain
MNPLSTKRILILAANPRDTQALRLKQEETDISNVLNRAKQRDGFELLLPIRGVTVREMQEKILNQEPQIVHFSGHGEGQPGIYLEDELGQAKLVSAEGLAGLFEICEQVECVILNACYSKVQARTIARHVPYVIGMNDSIGDRAALEFAYGFYTALGAGKSYEQAYKMGCTSIRMMDATGQEHEIPELITKEALESSPILWVQGWATIRSDSKPTFDLDWRSHYQPDTRQIPALETWDRELFPQIVQVREAVDTFHLDQPIQVQSTAPLTAMLAVGWQFPEMGRFRFQLQVQQRTGETVNTWESNAVPSRLKFKVVEEGQPGDHVVVAFGITGDPRSDVQTLLDESPGQFSAVIYAEPESGTGSAAIDNADAVALAIAAKDVLRQARTRYRAACLHLILYAPAGFCLFLGQRLNALGEIVAYERKPEGGYCPAVRLRTR